MWDSGLIQPNCAKSPTLQGQNSPAPQRSEISRTQEAPPENGDGECLPTGIVGVDGRRLYTTIWDLHLNTGLVLSPFLLVSWRNTRAKFRGRHAGRSVDVPSRVPICPAFTLIWGIAPHVSTSSLVCLSECPVRPSEPCVSYREIPKAHNFQPPDSRPEILSIVTRQGLATHRLGRRGNYRIAAFE